MLGPSAGPGWVWLFGGGSRGVICPRGSGSGWALGAGLASQVRSSSFPTAYAAGAGPQVRALWRARRRAWAIQAGQRRAMGVWHALGARAAAIRGDGPCPELAPAKNTFGITQITITQITIN